MDQPSADPRLMSAALDASAHGVVITDVAGTIEYVNPAFLRMTGYSPAEVLGENVRLFKSDRTPPSVLEDLWSTILAGGAWHGELMDRRKDGSVYCEEQTITPVRDDKGGISHFLAVKTDVTGRLRAEAALRSSQERLRLVWENSADGMRLTDARGSVL